MRKCGLFIYPAAPELAATPDGLIDSDTIVEVKCPFTGRLEKIKPGKNFTFLTKTDGQITMKTTHKYYYQVQGQLGITGAKTCIFIVHTKVDMLKILINFEKSMWEDEMVPTLRRFYRENFLKFIAAKL